MDEPELREAMEAIVGYMYRRELEHYQMFDQPSNHIFLSVRVLADHLEETAATT